jgi:hypothetical protein
MLLEEVGSHLAPLPLLFSVTCRLEKAEPEHGTKAVPDLIY